MKAIILFYHQLWLQGAKCKIKVMTERVIRLTDEHLILLIEFSYNYDLYANKIIKSICAYDSFNNQRVACCQIKLNFM